ncbi:MAG TPA: SprT family protein [Plesiomonas shigelloides]|nr:SprT family protein [Plesiomonas shigelloides]
MPSPRLPTALQQEVMQCLRQYLAMAADYFDSPFPEPRVSYRQRGMSAGSAHLQLGEIRLNPVLLQENGSAFIQEVIPHELAHLLAYWLCCQPISPALSAQLPAAWRKRRSRIAPHGAEWCWLMEMVLGRPARRTHRFDVSNVRGRTVAYQCACQQHALSIRRHNRVLRGENRYLCRQCQQELKPLALATTTTTEEKTEGNAS